jgi:hypothetical protein
MGLLNLEMHLNEPPRLIRSFGSHNTAAVLGTMTGNFKAS